MEYQYSYCLQDIASGVSRLGEVRTAVCVNHACRSDSVMASGLCGQIKTQTSYVYMKILRSNKIIIKKRIANTNTVEPVYNDIGLCDTPSKPFCIHVQ
jgi:hypothetical protein